MPEWLRDAAGAQSPIELETLAVRLVVAAVLGGAVSAVYRLSHGRVAREARVLGSTLVLLTILLSMVTMVIGESVARAFGLVGALSIVRFRTIVDDTRDTAFVIFAVIVGMAVGTGYVMVALAGIPVVGVIAVALAPRRVEVRPAEPVLAERARGSHSLTVRAAAGREIGGVVEPVLSRLASGHRLVGASSARQGAAIDCVYSVSLEDSGGVATLVAALNALEGVQSVEIRES